MGVCKEEACVAILQMSGGSGTLPLDGVLGRIDNYDGVWTATTGRDHSRYVVSSSSSSSAFRPLGISLISSNGW